MTPKPDKISSDPVDTPVTIPVEGLAARPTQMQLLQRSLESSGRVARLAMNHPGMESGIRAALTDVVDLLRDWAVHANGLTEEAEGKDREAQALREVINAQVHRLEMADGMLADMTTRAKKDHLTGAWNEMALAETAPKVFERMMNAGKNMSCIFLDLDFFKLVNDEHGHAGGNEVLREVFRIIGEKSRLSDFLFRMGGAAEEFCLLLPETDVEGAVILAERIREHLEKNAFIVNGDSVRVTASIGVAQADFSRHEGWKSTISRADLAQKEAKKTRNTVVSSDLVKDPDGSPEYSVQYHDRSPEDRYIPDSVAANSRYIRLLAERAKAEVTA